MERQSPPDSFLWVGGTFMVGTRPGENAHPQIICGPSFCITRPLHPSVTLVLKVCWDFIFYKAKV